MRACTHAREEKHLGSLLPNAALRGCLSSHTMATPWAMIITFSHWAFMRLDTVTRRSFWHSFAILTSRGTVSSRVFTAAFTQTRARQTSWSTLYEHSSPIQPQNAKSVGLQHDDRVTATLFLRSTPPNPTPVSRCQRSTRESGLLSLAAA